MHKIYDPDSSSGITLNKAQFADLQFSFSSIYGFFYTEVIEEILAKPECVGIRFYALECKSVHRIAACGVNSHGFDIMRTPRFDTMGYYYSQQVLGNQEAQPWQKKPREYIYYGAGYIKTSAFFSKSDLEKMLLCEKIDGLTIYLANLTNMKDIVFSVDHSLIAFRTTLIVEKAKTQIKGKSPKADNNEHEVRRKDIPLSPQIEGNILSLYPYPGHGVRIDYLISQNVAESFIYSGVPNSIYAPLNNSHNQFSKLYKRNPFITF